MLCTVPSRRRSQSSDRGWRVLVSCATSGVSIPYSTLPAFADASGCEFAPRCCQEQCYVGFGRYDWHAYAQLFCSFLGPIFGALLCGTKARTCYYCGSRLTRCGSDELSIFSGHMLSWTRCHLTTAQLILQATSHSLGIPEHNLRYEHASAEVELRIWQAARDYHSDGCFPSSCAYLVGSLSQAALTFQLDLAACILFAVCEIQSANCALAYGSLACKKGRRSDMTSHKLTILRVLPRVCLDFLLSKSQQLGTPGIFTVRF
eukprot:6185678-Pleurochrysis_carterae.AAC.1